MAAPDSGLNEEKPKAPRWPWALLALAMLWAALVRVPLILNAESHLDSDLAVDGLTLLEAVQGNWRWHYPGTPHIGTTAVLLSMPQAAIWGAKPWTLVSGGLVAYEGLLIASFLLAWRLFGPVVASWSLLPLAFGSIGSVWLSSRISGSHLLAAAWHAAAFAWLVGLLRYGGIGRAAWLGIWCGLGLYSDNMFVCSLLGLIPAAVSAGFGPGRPIKRFVSAVVFFGALLVGYAPHEIGARVEGYDAYPATFSTIFGDDRRAQIDWDASKAMATEHVRLLTLECVPRLVAGHRLPGLQSDPTREALGGPGRLGGPTDYHPLPILATLLSLGLLSASAIAFLIARGDREDLASLACRWGLLMSSLAILAGFVLNRNIFDSDNYRYLVFLMTPWALGLGLFLRWLSRRGQGGRTLAILLATALAVIMTLDTARWYRGLGWIDPAGRPVRVPLQDPALDWLRENPDVRLIYGGYWDVYRLAFLDGGRVRGVPYPEYPDRYYPELTVELPGGRPRTLIARNDPFGVFNHRLALSEGGQLLAEGRGYWIIDWPVDSTEAESELEAEEGAKRVED